MKVPIAADATKRDSTIATIMPSCEFESYLVIVTIGAGAGDVTIEFIIPFVISFV